MFKSLDIQKGMEVVGLDSKHVGTVDHLETADRIVLSKDDPKAGGRQHLISIDWVDYVDQKPILINTTAGGFPQRRQKIFCSATPALHEPVPQLRQIFIKNITPKFHFGRQLSSLVAVSKASITTRNVEG
jgi:hypothetical protein